MGEDRLEQFEERILVLAPTSRDANTSGSLFAAAGIRHCVCASIEAVCQEAGRGAGAAVVTAEAVLGDTEGCLAAWLRRQPPWSDFPLVVLTAAGPESLRLLEALEAVGHMTLMKRPVQVSTLLSVVRAALRDRQRQYAVRDLLMERQRAAEALRQERERYRVTLASIGDAVIATDTEGRVTFLNRVAEQLTGWDASALGRPLEEVFRIVHETTRQPVQNPVRRALKEGATVSLANHTILIARDATERPIDDSAAPIRGAQGELIGSVLVSRDVTDKKRAEKALRESEALYRRAAAEALQAAEANAKFRAFFEQGTNFAGVLTLDGTVIEANRLCLDACGFTRADVLKKPFWECGWWNRSADRMDMIRTAVLQAAGGRVFRTETKYYVAGGAERVVDLTLAPVVDEAGRVLFVAATGTDVTERKHMDDALRESDRKKDDFIALLAHELRNPLAPIRNGLQVMRLAGGDPGAIKVARAMMERQLTHMVRLIDDLLDISRVNRNKLELRRSRVLLSDVVSDAVETSRPVIEAAGHELSVSLPPDPIYLDADLTRLAQVFSNLLTNSAKYTERGGRIWLSAELRKDAVSVCVRDSGTGIPADALPLIFDMFSQVDRPIERATGGLGIGLALVKALVEMHGGTVAAASAGEGQGSAFTVTLPVLESPSEPVEVPAANHQQHCGPKRRVLVVDDNRDSAKSMAMMLELLGHEVITAHDGIEAVEVAAAARPQVILMDVGMPRLNGLDAARRIRQEPWGHEVVIVALTGWGQKHDRQGSREAGCNGHLVKPVMLDDLLKMLGELQGNER